MYEYCSLRMKTAHIFEKYFGTIIAQVLPCLCRLYYLNLCLSAFGNRRTALGERFPNVCQLFHYYRIIEYPDLSYVSVWDLFFLTYTEYVYPTT